MNVQAAIKSMMYGFGDVSNPLPESVELMEQLANDFISEMVPMQGCYELIMADTKISSCFKNKESTCRRFDFCYS